MYWEEHGWIWYLYDDDPFSVARVYEDDGKWAAVVVDEFCADHFQTREEAHAWAVATYKLNRSL